MTIPFRRKRKRKQRGRPRYPHKPARLRPPQPPGLSNIRLYRKQLGWTQEQLAEESGVMINTIYSIEQGKTIDPKLSTLLKLSKALRVRLGVLVGVENPMNPVVE